MARDEIFTRPVSGAFEFDEKVAAVFDDMIDRSVPFYAHNLALIADLLARRLQSGASVLDLGSSTGTLLIELARRRPGALHLIGVDNAPAMVERARKKADALDADVTFVCDDILSYEFGRPDAIVANYTLQFIRPLDRLALVQKIHDALRPDGWFVLSEKILMNDKRLDRLVIDVYYDFKRAQGYSDTEIMRKREALENVLVPYTIDENKTMLKNAGFESVDTIFQWGNFVTMVAAKGGA
jgi:tRNA (cmo5U34)-methyltransferase